jgi:hypothetical protein
MNFNQETTHTTKTVLSPPRYCPQDVMSSPTGTVPEGRAWPISCRCIVKAVIIAAAMADSTTE